MAGQLPATKKSQSSVVSFNAVLEELLIAHHGAVLWLDRRMAHFLGR